MLESKAKLKIQESVRSGEIELVWSYILDFEKTKNPFRERREQIKNWHTYAVEDVDESEEIVQRAEAMVADGIGVLDALHLACAVEAKADYFLTTDDGIMEKHANIRGVKVTDPVGFIRKENIR